MPTATRNVRPATSTSKGTQPTPVTKKPPGNASHPDPPHGPPWNGKGAMVSPPTLLPHHAAARCLQPAAGTIVNFTPARINRPVFAKRRRLPLPDAVWSAYRDEVLVGSATSPASCSYASGTTEAGVEIMQSSGAAFSEAVVVDEGGCLVTEVSELPRWPPLLHPATSNPTNSNRRPRRRTIPVCTRQGSMSRGTVPEAATQGYETVLISSRESRPPRSLSAWPACRACRERRRMSHECAILALDCQITDP